MGKIIAIANHKGGVAKTTTTQNIGAILSRKGYKVLLVDLDPQTNLTSICLSEAPTSTMYEAFVQGTPIPVVSITPTLSIAPSSVHLAFLETKLGGEKDRNLRLKKALSTLSSSYDYILLDCPPSLGTITLNALIAATDVYIPIQLEPIPLRGLDSLTDIIKGLQAKGNTDLKLSGVIITRWLGRTINKILEETLRKKFGEIVFKTRIRENIAVAEAPLERVDVSLYNSKANGAKDYTSLVEEIITRTK